MTVEDGVSALWVKKLVNRFKFRPPEKIFSQKKIVSVVASGLSLSELRAYENEIINIKAREKVVVEKEKQLENATDDVANLKSQASSIQSEVGKLTAQKNELQDSISKAKLGISENNSKLKDAISDVSIQQETLRSLKAEASAVRSELNELTREVRLFPSEIVGFVKEGNRSINWYIAISLPFVVIMYIVLSAMFSSAIDLTQLWRVEEDVNVWMIFLTRLPFVVVAAALVESCGYIVGRLISEIVRINRQRLEFSKLSIIAKDVSAASAKDTELSDEEIFDKETALKMDLLREQMKNLSGQEFEYKGGALISSLVGVANKLAGRTGGV